MSTWADLNAELDVLLDDEGAASYGRPLRLAAFNHACETFATTHTAPLKTLTLTPSPNGGTPSGVGAAIDLPVDLIQLGGVMRDRGDGRRTWLRPCLIIPGEDEDIGGYLSLGEALYFPPSPEGNADLTDVTVWYYALYVSVSADADPIPLPTWAVWPVVNLAIAYLLTPSAVGVADLRRWATKRDAGQLEENPSRAQMEFHVKQYLSGVSRVKQQDRETLYRTVR
jgi:hypothetical protein